MTHRTHDIGVASQIGKYSDAIEVRSNMQWLITSGTPGVSAASKLPDDFVGQAELAWQNVASVLAKADMTVANIVKVTRYLTRADDIKAYAGVRTRFLGDHRPAAMLLVVPQLVWPKMLIEIEIIAVKTV